MDLDELAGLAHEFACGVFAPASEFADIVNAEQPIALSGTSGESRCGRLRAILSMRALPVLVRLTRFISTWGAGFYDYMRSHLTALACIKTH